MNIQHTFVFLFALSLIGFAGCGNEISPETAIQNANKTNIQRLTNLYVRHQLQNQGRGPNDEAAFKNFIKTTDSATLSKIGVDSDSLDELFISERDSQPFDINYAVVGSTRGSNKAIVFEKTGVDGTRMVGFTSLAVKEVSDDAEYRKLLAGEEVSQSDSQAQLPSGAGR